MVKHSSFKTELEECLNLIQTLKHWEYHPIFAEPVGIFCLCVIKIVKTFALFFETQLPWEYQITPKL